MDGANVTHKYKDDYSGLWTFRASSGKMVIESQEEIQKEAFKVYSKDFEMNPVSDVYDISAKLERKYMTVYAARQTYHAKLETDNPTRRNLFIANMFEDSTYTLDRFGLRLLYKEYFISMERSLGDTEIKSSKGTVTTEVKATDTNYVIGKYFNEHVIYAGHSIGHNKTASTHNRDTFIGVTYNPFSYLTLSLAKHKGSGTGWAKYETAALGEYDWNTWVLSTTLKF
jgi:hypothetical protein